MILMRPGKVKEWLSSIEKNQTWLAHELSIGKAYLSQCLHNRCKMSRPMIERMLNISRMPFEAMFYMNNVPDQREFYGAQIFWGRMMTSDEYNKVVDDILEKNPPNGKNNHLKT